jgi:hypothetical protein
MINDIDAIRRRSTPSRKNAEHDVLGSPCGLSALAFGSMQIGFLLCFPNINPIE